jgi:small subunit ribosomal protein S16
VWRVVVADQRSPRDGRVIETIGHYNAQTQPSTVVIDEVRARTWIARGAQPTKAVSKLLRISEGSEARRAEAAAESPAAVEPAAEGEDAAPASADEAPAADADTPADEVEGAET